MNITAAIESRISCRAFLGKPVPGPTVVALLETAKRAPSGGNLQPWLVHVLTGESLAGLLATVRSKLPTQPAGEGMGYDIYPPKLLLWHGAGVHGRKRADQFTAHGRALLQEFATLHGF